MDFERVYTMTEYNDGPRAGIAGFEGRPCMYECEWNEVENRYNATFKLSPISDDVLALALEDWDIWTRWWAAFDEGCTAQETSPALPEDRARHAELEAQLREKLRIDPTHCTRAFGEFRTVAGWDGKGLAPLEVRWVRCGQEVGAADNFASFWRRLAALLLDGLVFLPVNVAVMFAESASKRAAMALTVAMPGLSLAYTIYGHGRFGKTVGKWLMRIRVERATGGRIGWREAWLRSSADLLLSVPHAVGKVMALAAVADAAYSGAGWSQQSAIVYAHEPRWSVWMAYAGMIWFWSEVLTMLFNKRRRALHDFIAGTVVVSDRRASDRTTGGD